MCYFQAVPGQLSSLNITLLTQMSLLQSTLIEHEVRYSLSCNTRPCREGSGSVVECLTRDRGAVGSSLTGVTALCLWARTLILA